MGRESTKWTTDSLEGLGWAQICDSRTKNGWEVLQVKEGCQLHHISNAFLRKKGTSIQS